MRFSLVVHGGTLDTIDNQDPQLAVIRQALADGRQRLQQGDRAIDVVQAVVRQLEDSGLLNAGKGSKANAAGFVETDAAIMDGRTGAAGAVASMRHLRNPITAARLVMEKSPHVLMAGDRGEAYVAQLGAELVSADYYVNNHYGTTFVCKQDVCKADKHTSTGTVGAVAMDGSGDLAAATSTGGFDAKIPGRIGDTPIIGAGTYAQNNVAAISATGHGEFFIRHTVAADLAARVKYLCHSLDQSARKVLQTLRNVGAEGGIIGVSPEGAVVMRYNCAGMLRGSTTPDQPPVAFAYE